MTFNLLSQLTDRSTNKEDEDEGSPVDDVGVETDDESDVNFDVEEGEGDGLRLDSSDDDGSESLYQLNLHSSPSHCLTPNYPNQYPLNAFCDWTVSSTKDLAASASSLLLLSFSSLSLAQSHSISVLRTEKNQTEVARYGGMVASNLPDDIILPRAPELTVAFSSQPGPSPSLSGSINDVAGGASLNYWILECGGNLTAADGSFTSPEFSKPPTKSAFCVWILNVGQVNETDKSTNIVSFNISAVGKDAKSLTQYLKIYDGPSLRSPFLPLNAKASNLSRFDSIIVLFNFTFDSSSKPDVRLNFTYKTKSKFCFYLQNSK
ncbi:cub and zona pellucida-like domain-containing protein 1 [Plakobranchus ocellatus]|uniref:Cub and zona pellucida-like domain-containing protein 1 n=1 Tax=Plakobranchus ocellatus TaxID=259542 RepID=A0AAV3ZUT8_9GAST|nr:cub and zona pellucida-like domain-containing protein 1 [Plakobranchus ocellatus]